MNLVPLIKVMVSIFYLVVVLLILLLVIALDRWWIPLALLALLLLAGLGMTRPGKPR